ncbi:MAG: hypothetical protein JXA73_19470 [Acidobacteria bacterium]|nr:hypothetical protein [Acidobacteriota bacterium]
MKALRNRILQKKHIWADLLCMICLVILALSAHSVAGSPGKAASAFRRMPSGLKPYAIALGQRLQKAGRERITATGTILQPGDSGQQTDSVRITWQYPLKIQLDKGKDSLTFDRNGPARAEIGDRQMADTIQMLLEDSTEGLFAIQKDRISQLYLGSGFTLEGAGESDPAMDIVMISYPDVFRKKQPILKSYWFDSHTKLLGVVAYANASGALVHVVINDWREVEGEKIPFRIERWENNKLAMRLNLDSAKVSAGEDEEKSGGN